MSRSTQDSAEYQSKENVKRLQRLYNYTPDFSPDYDPDYNPEKSREKTNIGGEARDATEAPREAAKEAPMESEKKSQEPADRPASPRVDSPEKSVHYPRILPSTIDPDVPGPSGLQQGKRTRYGAKKHIPKIFKKGKRSKHEPRSEIQEYHDMMAHLVEIIRQYEPTFSRELAENPTAIISAIQKILERLDEAWRDIPLTFDQLKGLKGTNWSYEVKKLQARVSDVINDHNKHRSELAKEIADRDAEILRLKGQVTYNENLVKQYRFGNLSKDKQNVAHFRAVFVQKEVEKQILQKELARLNERNDYLETEIVRLQEQVAALSMEKIEYRADMVKEIKLWANDEITQYIMDRIKTLADPKEDVHNIAQEWIEVVKETYEDVKDQLDELREQSKFLEQEYGVYLFTAQQYQRRLAELSYETSILEELVEVREEKNRSLRQEIQELGEVGSYLEFQAQAYKTSSPKQAMGPPEQARWGSPRSPYAAENILDAHSLSLEDSGPAPIIPSVTVTPPSPTKSPDNFGFSARPHIIEPEMPDLSEPRLVIDPSTQTISGVSNRFEIGRGMNMHTVHSGSPAPYHQMTRVKSVISPQPGPSRMLDSPLNVQHRASVIPPVYKTPWISTQSRYGYTDPEYRMLNIPPGGFIEMDTALKKQYMLMSPQREEPLLVNIDVDPKPLVQTEDGEHFVCDISLNVQQAGRKKPPRISPVVTFGQTPAITPTTDRRQFSWFTPPGIFKKKHYNFRRIQDKFDDSPGKYFLPHYLPHDGRSPLTHLSTPPSLLSDRTISWERVPGLEDEFEQSYSPVIKGIIDVSSTDFSDSSFERTPPSQRSPSPVIQGYADMRSSPRLDGTFERSPSPVIQRPPWLYPGTWTHTDSSHEDESLSPVIKGIRDLSSTDFSDRSFERTPPSQRSTSPVIQGYADMRSSPRLEGTFERSPSPAIKGIIDLSSTDFSDSSFERTPQSQRSPSPVIQGYYADMSSSPSIDRSFTRSVSPQMNRICVPSPRPEGTFERSPSPVIQRPSRAYPVTWSYTDSSQEDDLSPVIKGIIDLNTTDFSDSSFERTPPSQRSPLPMIQGYADMSSSPSIDRSFTRSVSPQMNRTFERSPSPVIRRFVDMSSSSDINESFDRSISPQMNATFERSPSPLIDRSFDRSSSPRFDGTFERSPSSLSRAHQFNTMQGQDYSDMSSSPSAAGSFDRNTSRFAKIAFDRSQSPLTQNIAFERSQSPLKQNIAFEQSQSPFTTFNSHMYGRPVDHQSHSMPSDSYLNHSVSPRTYNSDMSSFSSGYDNPFNPNNSIMSPSGLSPHSILNSSMPPRLGGVFSQVPSRLTRTV